MKMWEGRIILCTYVYWMQTQNVASGILDYYEHP